MDNINLHNFIDRSNSPTKRFSAYGVDTSFLKTPNKLNENLNSMSEIDFAVQKAKEFHEKQRKLKGGDPDLNKPKNEFSKLGESIEKTKKMPDFLNISDNEIQNNIKKASEINKKYAPFLNQNTSTDEILSSIIGELF